MPPKPRKSCGGKMAVFIGAMLCAAFLVLAALRFCPIYSRPVPTGLQNIPQRLGSLENRLQDLEEQIKTIQAMATSQNTASNAPPPSNVTTDIGHLQNDIASLTTSLGTLENQVKDIASHYAQTRAATQTSLAEALAFISLREAALSGHPFAEELASMRKASASDEALGEPLGRLDTLAGKGVPTPAALLDELLARESSAETTTEKATAQGWWERLLAELKQLISIRRVHGGTENGTFTPVESALARNDITAALAALKNLPPEMQQALADWQAKAESRQTAEDAVRNISSHLTTSPQGTP
jgi:hypothetical protein